MTHDGLSHALRQQRSINPPRPEPLSLFTVSGTPLIHSFRRCDPSLLFSGVFRFVAARHRHSPLHLIDPAYHYPLAWTGSRPRPDLPDCQAAALRRLRTRS
jgi:hypothetical protein